MIRIAIGTEDLELSPSTSIEWVRVNQLFEDDVEMRADHSFNFKISCTPNNGRILDQSCKSFAATMFVEGVLWARGKLHILGQVNDGWNVTFVTTVLIEEGKKGLRDLSFDPIDVDVPDRFTFKDNANSLAYPDTNFVFPWINNISQNATDRKLASTQVPADFINEPSTNPSSGDRTDLLSPQFFLKYIIKESVAQSTGMEADGKLLDFIDEYLIYNNTALTSNILLDPTFMNVNFGSGFTRSSIFFPSDLSVNVGDILHVDISAPTSAVSGFTPFLVSYVFQASDFTPLGDIDFATFFANYEAYILSLGIYAEAYSDPVFDLYFSLNGIVDLSDPNKRWRIELMSNEDLITVNHLPDMTIPDFWKALKDFFALSIVPDYRDNKMYFIPRKCLLQTSKYKDYTDKCLENSDRDCGDPVPLRFVYQNDTTDECTKDSSVYRSHANNHPEHNEDGYGEYSIGAATTDSTLVVVGSTATPANIDTRNMPKVNQPMQDYESIGSDEFSLRFLKWEGIVSDIADVPQATTDGLSPNEAYTEWWAEWYQLIKSGASVVKFPMMLNSTDIRELDPRLKWKIGHHNYLWKEIRTTISMRHGIETSMVSVVKVQYADDTI